MVFNYSCTQEQAQERVRDTAQSDGSSHTSLQSLQQHIAVVSEAPYWVLGGVMKRRKPYTLLVSSDQMNLKINKN